MEVETDGYRMCAVAIVALTRSHPGIYFKPMTLDYGTSEEKSAGSDVEAGSVDKI